MKKAPKQSDTKKETALWIILMGDKDASFKLSYSNVNPSRISQVLMGDHKHLNDGTSKDERYQGDIEGLIMEAEPPNLEWDDDGTLLSDRALFPDKDVMEQLDNFEINKIVAKQDHMAIIMGRIEKDLEMLRTLPDAANHDLVQPMIDAQVQMSRLKDLIQISSSSTASSDELGKNVNDQSTFQVNHESKNREVVSDITDYKEYFDGQEDTKNEEVNQEPVLWCEDPRQPFSPTGQVTTRGFASQDPISISIKLGEKTTSFVQQILDIIGEEEKFCNVLKLGDFCLQKYGEKIYDEKMLSNFKFYFTNSKTFGLSAYSLEIKYSGNQLRIKIEFCCLIETLKDFLSSSFMCNKNLQTETVLVFNSKEIKKHLKLLEHLTNSFNADNFQQISLNSEDDVFTLEIPPSLYSNLQDRPMVNPQVNVAVHGAKHGDKEAKPEQVDGHYIICEHDKDK